MLTIAAGALLLFIASLSLRSAANDSQPQLTQTDVRRNFYLTKGAFTGSRALKACATGYHMASIWEIQQTAFLRYNTTLGRTDGDSIYGGPPSYGSGNLTGVGWIRLGASFSNCNLWTSSSPADVGSSGELVIGAVPPTPVWAIQNSASVGGGLNCDGTYNGTQYNPGVWCVQN